MCEKYSSHPIFTNQLPNFAEVIVGEDKSDVSLDTWQQFLQLRVLVQVSTNYLANCRILTCQRGQCECMRCVFVGVCYNQRK